MEGNSAAQDLESSKIDNLTRAELNRTMTEWSVRLQTLLENERGKHRDGTTPQTPEQSKIKVFSLFLIYRTYLYDDITTNYLSIYCDTLYLSKSL